MKKLITLFLFIISFSYFVLGNNIQIANIKLLNKNTVLKTIQVKFDISWENSWRISNESANWDAAWIFIKYRVNNGEWHHARLSSTASNHFAPAGSVISAVSDSTGVFIYRSEVGSGTNNWTGVKLLWDYGKAGISNNSGNIEVKVFGIEMVYVPKGSFYIGDGAANGRFRDKSKVETLPAYISTNPVVVRSKGTDYDDSQLEDLGVLVDGDGGIDVDGYAQVDNSNFPTGYSAFYCMKYEISEEQYAEFLNTLTRKQQVKRTIQNISGATIDRPFAFNTNGLAPQYRDAIRCVNNLGGTDNPLYFFCDLNNNNIPNELNDGQNIALIYFGWIDGAAYADWAGLRPMTELEFEKACRGTEYPVAGEFAWHAKRADSTEYTITQNGQADEYPGNPGTGARANAAYTKTTGHSTAIETPLRCGIFATSSSDRSQSGASYYGIMELSGNINEGCVTIGHIDGRKYKGTHGDGELTATEGYEGNATNSDWPGIDINNPGYGVISSTGTGSRGGDWNDGYIMVSERVLAAGDPYGRNPGSGFRCVRTINN